VEVGQPGAAALELLRFEGPADETMCAHYKAEKPGDWGRARPSVGPEAASTPCGAWPRCDG